MFKPGRIEPLRGQESVWDYPRPPKLESVSKRLRVVFQGVVIADTSRGFRVLETSHPPVYYIGPEDIALPCLEKAQSTSWCEFKGSAVYWTLTVQGRRSENAAWSYLRPTSAFEAIAGYFAFYASRVDECWVDDERVVPQAGDFYGGWITSDIVGPFKGASGTRGW